MNGLQKLLLPNLHALRTQDRNSYFEVIWWGIDRNKSTILIDSSRIASGTSLKLVITLVGSCIKIKVAISQLVEFKILFWTIFMP